MRRNPKLGQVGNWADATFQFSKLLSPNCTSRRIPSGLTSANLSAYLVPCSRESTVHSAWTVISQDSQTEISPLLLFIPSQAPHGVSALCLLAFQGCVFMYCVNPLPPDLSFGSKRLCPLLNLDHTSQPIHLERYYSLSWTLNFLVLFLTMWTSKALNLKKNPTNPQTKPPPKQKTTTQPLKKQNPPP